MREIDLILAGPKGESPAEIARANAEAMQALGGVGAVKSRRKKQAS